MMRQIEGTAEGETSDRRLEKADELPENEKAAVSGAPPGNEPGKPLPVGAEAVVTVSADGMEANLELRPPEKGGAEATYDLVEAALIGKGVVFGVLHEEVHKAVDEAMYGVPVYVARGTRPTDGEDARIVYHFETKRSGSPQIGEDGRADYRTLDLFTAVSKGDRLAEKVPATAGTPGRTVRGVEIKPRNGRDIRLPTGKNIDYDEERMNIFARISGRADLAGSSIIVSDCYTVKGDADLSVGNIDFDGDIVITGNVISDLVIKAARGIEVRGSVEGSKLVAGANIVIRGGMQGNDKGVLEAGGYIRAKYIERATIRSEGSVFADSIIHCQTESGESIVTQGHHGSIIGGSARAHSRIVAQCIGSVSHTKTEVAVGMLPSKRARLQFLRTELTRLKAEMDRLEKTGKYLSQSEDLSIEKQQLKKAVVLEKIKDTSLIREYTEEARGIEEKVQSAGMGDISVRDTVYPNVRITVSLGDYNVTSQVKFTTFTCRDGEVSLSPYRG